MDTEQREKIKKWIDGWSEVDRVQQDLRKVRIISSKTADSILALDGAFRAALLRSPKRLSSGFVEFHRLFAKTR